MVYAVVRSTRTHTQVVSLFAVEISAQAFCDGLNDQHARANPYTVVPMTVLP